MVEKTDKTNVEEKLTKLILETNKKVMKRNRALLSLLASEKIGKEKIKGKAV